MAGPGRALRPGALALRLSEGLSEVGEQKKHLRKNAAAREFRGSAEVIDHPLVS